MEIYSDSFRNKERVFILTKCFHWFFFAAAFDVYLFWGEGHCEEVILLL